MYNFKDIQFVGKHDFDKDKAELWAAYGGKTFSVNIFKWELKSNGKSMKQGKGVVRVVGSPNKVDQVFQMCEYIVKELDNNEWDGRKTVTVK